MKFFSLFIFSSLFHNALYACEVELFDKVYKVQKEQRLQAKDLIRSSNCQHDVLAKIAQILSNADGTIGSDFIEQELQKDLNTKIEITSKKISIFDLNDVIKTKLILDPSLEFTDYKSLSSQPTINLSQSENLSVSCENCRSLGEKNIKVDVISPLNGQNKSVWFTAKLNSRIMAVKARKNISFQQTNLSADDFVIEETLTTHPENILTSLDNIHFYRANRLILQNSIVSTMDILPINLVNYGTPVKAVLNSDSIALERVLLPARSARFNEMIELNGPNNKKIIGKVIDFNKVVIDL